MKKKVLTLCLIHQHPKILLGMKKRGFGQGKWNGFGGKIQEGETIEEATLRELREEAGIDAVGLIKRAIMEFEFENNPEILEVHLFSAKDFDGEIVESEEMLPKWFHIDEIPFKDMWPDDLHWMPLFLKGKNWKGKFLFDNSGSRIINKVLEEVSGY